MYRGKILIGSPICQEPEILKAFLNSLSRLNIDNFEMFYHFIDDNHDLRSQLLLNGFQEANKNVTVERISESSEAQPYRNHQWTYENIWKVANYKDRIIERAHKEEFDYLFLIDSDLLLYPQTVSHLINTGKDIIAEIFWTKWAEFAIEQPQVWLSDFYTQCEKQMGEVLSQNEEKIRTHHFFQKLRCPGVYEVGGLGACTLISKTAIERGVSFRPIKNLSLWGEDRHFCVRAIVLGIDLFVDTHYPSYHIFRAEELHKGLEFLENTAIYKAVQAIDSKENLLP